MEYRFLGGSGLRVPVLSFGTATFGGTTEFFKAWGATQVSEAKRLIDICMDAGVNLFDTADIYSQGQSEAILGEALRGHARDQIILSTKASFSFGSGVNNSGASRLHLSKQIEGSLKRLKTDYIDIFHMHGFDANTPVEETLRTLDDFVRSGKIRYIAASNFSGWHLMKSLGIADKYGWSKYIAHQVYYSLANRDYEWELMPLAEDQQVGAIIWSPLSAGRLGGKYGRNKPIPQASRIAQGGSPVPEMVVSESVLYNIIDVLSEIQEETGKTMAQIALNWLLQRPTVSSIIVGARNEAQLQENLGAVGWKLSLDQIKRLDQASETPPTYPYWHQWQHPFLNAKTDLYQGL